jgi:hypothetical protein
VTEEPAESTGNKASEMENMCGVGAHPRSLGWGESQPDSVQGLYWTSRKCSFCVLLALETRDLVKAEHENEYECEKLSCENINLEDCD